MLVLADTVRAFGRTGKSFDAAGGAFAESLAADIADTRTVRIALPDGGAIPGGVGWAKDLTTMMSDANGAANGAGDAGRASARGGESSGIPKVHAGKQGKHIPGHNNFVPGKSILTADPKSWPNGPEPAFP